MTQFSTQHLSAVGCSAASGRLDEGESDAASKNSETPDGAACGRPARETRAVGAPSGEINPHTKPGAIAVLTMACAVLLAMIALIVTPLLVVEFDLAPRPRIASPAPKAPQIVHVYVDGVTR